MRRRFKRKNCWKKKEKRNLNSYKRCAHTTYIILQTLNIKYVYMASIINEISRLFIFTSSSIFFPISFVFFQLKTK